MDTKFWYPCNTRLTFMLPGHQMCIKIGTSTIFDARHQWWEARVKCLNVGKILTVSSLCRVKCKLYLRSKTQGERDYEKCHWRNPPAPGRSSKLTHTGVEIDTCAFQTGCQLSSAATGMSLELRFFTQFQWREAYVLDNWQLVVLSQSGRREFDPRRVHDNLSVPLWVYMRLPVPEHQN